MSKKKTNCLKLPACPPVADCGNKFLFSCVAGFCSGFSDSLDFLVLLYQDKRTMKVPLRLLHWSITKTAGTDTAAAFTDTVTYTIIVCGNVPKYHLSLQQTVHQALRLISAFKISDKNIY